jgi:hypothetical protein
MKILLEMSLEYYSRLLDWVSDKSPLYAVLKNPVVVHSDTPHSVIEILCDKFHARMFLSLAEELCPEAAAEIEEAIRLSHKLH